MSFQDIVWQLQRVFGQGKSAPEFGRDTPAQGQFFQTEVSSFKRNFVCQKLKISERQKLRLEAEI